MSKNNASAAPKAPEMIKHIVTDEDLATNPDLVEQGVAVGDEIEIPKPNVESISKAEVKITTKMVQRDSGIIAPETEVLVKQPFYAKKYDKKSWAVYSESGELKKIYSERDGTKPEDCERAANNLAKKLSNQFIAK
jgi:hypothetical protein